MSHQLLMPFIGDNDCPEFVRGFECGQIWEKMNKAKEFNSYLIHTANIEQIKLMCKRFHYDVVITTHDNEWSYMTATLSANAN